MRCAAPAAMLALAALTCAAADAPIPPAKPLHADPEGLRRAMAETLDGLLRDDAQTTRAALDLLERACRRVDVDETESLGAKLVQFDGAFHRQLDLARELAARGDLDRVTLQFHGVIKGCRGCHAEVAGIKSSNPSGTESPNPPSGSTPSR